MAELLIRCSNSRRLVFTGKTSGGGVSKSYENSEQLNREIWQITDYSGQQLRREASPRNEGTVQWVQQVACGPKPAQSC